MYPHNAIWIHNSDTTHNNGQDHTLTIQFIAADEHNSLAMLVRSDGETLARLLARLDQAIAKALEEE